MKTKMFLLDLDGTAGNTLLSIASTANRTLEEFGLPVQPVPNYRFYAGDGADVMIKRAAEASSETDPELIRKITARYRENFIDGCVYQVSSFPGLESTLTRLKKAGVRLAICSNKDQKMAEKVIFAIYGEGLFDVVYGISAELPAKPDPSMPLLASSMFSASPEECVYVGDTNTDMKCGKAAGMYTVGVTWGFRSREELIASGADLVIDRPEELLGLLEK